MKKFTAMLLVGVMTAGMLAGCGSSTSSTATSGASNETAETAETAGSDASTTETASSSAAPDWSGYDSLVKEIKSDTDLVDREAKMHQAEDMLMATGAVVPIYYYNDLYMQKSNVSGTYTTIFGNKYFMYATVQ